MLLDSAWIPSSAGGGTADYRCLAVLSADDRNVQFYGHLGEDSLGQKLAPQKCHALSNWWVLSWLRFCPAKVWCLLHLPSPFSPWRMMTEVHLMFLGQIHVSTSSTRFNETYLRAVSWCCLSPDVNHRRRSVDKAEVLLNLYQALFLTDSDGAEGISGIDIGHQQTLDFGVEMYTGGGNDWLLAATSACMLFATSTFSLVLLRLSRKKIMFESFEQDIIEEVGVQGPPQWLDS